MKNTQYPYYNTPCLNNMQELVRYCAKKYRDKTAFRYLDKKVEIRKSYEDFFVDVAAVCSFFIKSGYSRAHIAILGENSYEWLVTFFATVNSNNVVVPLDKELSVQDICKVIEKSDSTVLVYSDDYSDEAVMNENIILINMKEISEIIHKRDVDKNMDLSIYDTIAVDDDDAMCALFWTSGTTSEPKGVMLSHKNIVSDTIAVSKNVLGADSSLLTLPLHHTYGFVAGVTGPMLIGSSNFINNNTRYLMRDTKYAKPEYMAVVPVIAEFMYKNIWESAKNKGKEKTLRKLITVSDALCKIGIDLRRWLFSSIVDGFGGNLKILIIGGASIDPVYVKDFHSFGIKALVGYGITECSPIVSVVRNEHYCPESVGTILPGVFMRIKSGEIQIKGDMVFNEYYKNPEATADAFDGGWFKTGDLGELRDGFLYITGRTKNLIILSNGENVSPEELEQYFKSNIADINEILVYEKNGAITAELFVRSLDEQIKNTIENNIFELNKELPLYKQIKEVIFRDEEFPKTSTKKIKRLRSESL